LRLIGEIDVDALERYAFFGERNNGTLHIRTQNMADQG
jgi:hypothetical protein